MPAKASTNTPPQLPGLAARRAAWAVACLVAAALTGAVLVSVAPGSGHHDGTDARGPLDLRALKLHQHRKHLTVEIRTAGDWSPRRLEARPSMHAADPENYLCLELRQRDKHRRWCLAKAASGKTRLIGGHTNAAGEMRHAKRLRGARLHRRGSHSITARFPFARAGLHLGRFGWRGESGWGDPSCLPVPPPPREADPPTLAPCQDQAPNQSYFGGRILKPRIVGCTRDEDMFNTAGPRSHKAIALTFDDGPSSYTSRVIDILNHGHAHGTFFLVGENVPGHGSLMRRMIADGHEIGNHSLHHETSGASASSLRQTGARIRAATGFRPCLYRPPGGYVSASTSRAAWQQGMSNILWDVDPTDWSTPGTSAIYSRVVGAAHSGSIVLMHDGGGNRSQTVAALPHIISTLKSRGYRLVTVTALLNERFRWKP